MINSKYAAFVALDPFFDIVMQGLAGAVDVSVYLLEVFEIAKKWPEKGAREIKWCSPREAAILLHEPLLAELCGYLIR